MKNTLWLYPAVVGVLLGLLQTGLYFQLSFTLSSSFTTFLLVTVCWLLGSILGLWLAPRMQRTLNVVLGLALFAYFVCAISLEAAPFNTQLWWLYTLLVALIGVYPGMFFVRMRRYYTARHLFFRENNGFIVGLIIGTITFLLFGRLALWIAPVLIAVLVSVVTRRLEQASKSDEIRNPV